MLIEIGVNRTVLFRITTSVIVHDTHTFKRIDICYLNFHLASLRLTLGFFYIPVTCFIDRQ